MRRVLFSSVIAIAGAISLQAASAADTALPRYEAPPAAAFNWTGCYIGGSVGWLSGANTISSDIPNAYPFVTNQSLSFEGGTVGGYAGCNYQTGIAVWGIEGDFNSANVLRRDGIVDTLSGDEFYRRSMTWYGSIRGRVGLVAEGWHFYTTGGVAFSDQYVEYINVDASGTVEEQEGRRTRTGWTAGAGVERAMASNWIMRAEYLYFDFGTIRFVETSFGTGSYADARSRFHVGRVGVSYKFGAM